MAIVLPQGALFRKGAEGEIRKKLLQEDLIDSVIGLASNIFYGTGLAPAVVILRRTKPPKRKDRVIVIDASSLVREGRAQNYLDPEHVRQIVKWAQEFKDVDQRAKVATLDDIKNEDWTLNISRYVLPAVSEEIPPLPVAIAEFKRALAEAREAEDRLREILIEGDWLK